MAEIIIYLLIIVTINDWVYMFTSARYIVCQSR